MNPGELNKRISIQEMATTKDNEGVTKESWVTIATLWASAMTLTGRELISAKEIHAESTTRFKIRYRPGLKTSMRIKFKDRLFNILFINNVREQNKELLLLCKEVV